jgi:hypothetical protein
MRRSGRVTEKSGLGLSPVLSTPRTYADATLGTITISPVSP